MDSKRLRGAGRAMQPRTHRGRVGQVPARDAGRTRADQHADAVLRVDDGEGVFVGQIVAEEHGAATAERRLLQEARDGAALVGRALAGPQFEHFVAELHAVLRQQAQRRWPKNPSARQCNARFGPLRSATAPGNACAT